MEIFWSLHIFPTFSLLLLPVVSGPPQTSGTSWTWLEIEKEGGREGNRKSQQEGRPFRETAGYLQYFLSAYNQPAVPVTPPHLGTSWTFRFAEDREPICILHIQATWNFIVFISPVLLHCWCGTGSVFNWEQGRSCFLKMYFLLYFSPQSLQYVGPQSVRATSRLVLNVTPHNTLALMWASSRSAQQWPSLPLLSKLPPHCLSFSSSVPPCHSRKKKKKKNNSREREREREREQGNGGG